jgi:hypothetical protein
MSVMIAIMFVTVIATAVMLEPDWPAVVSGMAAPRIPAGGLGWTRGLLGGVGGTLTLLSYGYWIREEGREGAPDFRCGVELEELEPRPLFESDHLTEDAPRDVDRFQSRRRSRRRGARSG